jgi:hypothetical protein
VEPCLFLKVARPRKATQIHQENSERCLRRLNHSLKNLGPPSGSGTAAWLMHALEHVRYPKAPMKRGSSGRQLGVNLTPHANVIGKQAKRFVVSGVTHSCLRRPSSGQFLSQLPLHRNTSCRAISPLFVLRIDFYQYHFIGTIVIFTKTSAFVDYCSLPIPSPYHYRRSTIVACSIPSFQPHQ